MGRRRPRARAHAACAVGAVALALVVGACSSGGGSTATKAVVGKRAPTFVAPRLEGAGDVRLTDYRGKAVLVNFFASWCQPCRDELPLLQQTAADDRVVVIPVLFHDSASNARSFLRDLRVTLPAVQDDGAIARAYRVDFKPGLPMSFLVSRQGVLLARHIGQLRPEDVTSWLKLV